MVETSDKALTLQETLNLAMSCYRKNQILEAKNIYFQIIQAFPNNYEALFYIGCIENKLRSFPKAEAYFLRALNCNPKGLESYINLAEVFLVQKKYDDTEKICYQALKIKGDNIPVISILGRSFINRKNPNKALEFFKQAYEIDPNNKNTLNNLALAYTDLKNGRKALEYIEEIANDISAPKQVLNNAAYACLQLGDGKKSIEYCNRLLEKYSVNTNIIAVKSAALSLIRNKKEVNYLVNLKRDIHITPMKPNKKVYKSLKSFNKELTEYVANHPTLEASPKENATKNGWHTGTLENDDAPVIQEFKRLIHAEVERRIQNLPKDKNHPLTASKPEQYQLRIWSVKMRSQGHQIAHMHPTGWLSGVYYPCIPKLVKKIDKNRLGWIELGNWPEGFCCDVEQEVLYVCPKEGLMVTFPSWFGHATIPYETDEERISVAFDIIPAVTVG